MSPRALITGITGQDGSYLAELLLDKGYEVHGVVRRTSSESLGRIAHLAGRIQLHHGDLTDQRSLNAAVDISQPDEVYNLGAQSFVGASWNQPEHTANVSGLGALRMLEAVRCHAPDARYYQASSSEQFGSAPAPQSEATPFHPRSPYGVAKCFAHNMTVNYRESYGLHASCGILFNHESPRRGMEFVTRKIAWHAAAIKLGLADRLQLGDTSAWRDWGYAPDYVRAMWLMLQQPMPDDYVIGTAVAATVWDFVEACFRRLCMLETNYVDQDQAAHIRPAEVAMLLADPAKARDVLGWQPDAYWDNLAALMVDADLAALSANMGRVVEPAGVVA